MSSLVGLGGKMILRLKCFMKSSNVIHEPGEIARIFDKLGLDKAQFPTSQQFGNHQLVPA